MDTNKTIVTCLIIVIALGLYALIGGGDTTEDVPLGRMQDSLENAADSTTTTLNNALDTTKDTMNNALNETTEAVSNVAKDASNIIKDNHGDDDHGDDHHGDDHHVLKDHHEEGDDHHDDDHHVTQ